MFSDELGGNPAKKRADEAKARRLRAKKEKQAKEKRTEMERRKRDEASAISIGGVGTTAGETSTGDTVSNNDIGLQSSSAATAKTSTSIDTTKPTTQTTTNIIQSEELTATQKAAEQRKIRAEVRAKVSAATLIQSVIRCKLVATKARNDQRSIFDKRMSDLTSLASILRSTTNNNVYIPPPATVSIMITQFLFFACPTIIRKQRHSNGNDVEIILDSGSMILQDTDLSRWTKVIRNLLLAGVLSDDNLELDPLLPWMGSVEGKRRLHKVINLCVSSISCKQTPMNGKQSQKKKSVSASSDKPNVDNMDKCYTSVEYFLRSILRLCVIKGASEDSYNGKPRDGVYQNARSILMQTSSTENKEPSVSCDLISSLRTLLLYGPTKTNHPIPADCGRLRENCVTKDEKDRASILMKLVVDMIASLERGSQSKDQMTLDLLCSRFISEVMTVPLLTWKVLPASYQQLILSTGEKVGLKVPPLVNYIQRFINLNADEVSSGRVETVLNMSDISLTSCPAPAVLCLLASMVQMGRKCEMLNGMNPSIVHYKAAAEYFNFLATLINAAPLGTFSSRMSAVEWVSVGSSSTPIVLSDVVIEQCSAILSDSYVRALFTCAINDEELDTNKVINTITDKDRRHEKDLEELGTSSAASVAAKEAMVDRNRSFWQSSKWAKKLTSFISGESGSQSSKPTKSNKGVGKLMNTSSIARQLANGKGSMNRTAMTNAVLQTSSEDKEVKTNTKKPIHEYSVLFLLALCRCYGTIISRWGGDGKVDLVQRSLPPFKEYASENTESCVTALLNVLCFSTSFVTSSWAIIQSNPRVVSDLYQVIDVRKRGLPIRTLTAQTTYKHLQHSNYGAADGNVGAVVLLMFVTCLSHTLIVTDDVEIHEMEKPMPKHQLRRCILLLRKLLYRACCLDDVHDATKQGRGVDSNHSGLALISTASKLQNDLYSRSSRRLLCVPKLWIKEGLLENDLKRCREHHDYTLLLSSPVCRICPFLVSFKRRLKLFERIVTTNRTDIQGSNEQRNLKPGIMIKINRGRVLEDGLAHMNKLGRDLRQRLVVSYLSEAGARETGIDVGGLFKEFWTDLSNIAFDPNWALFKNTEGALMYRNPSSKLAHGADHIVLFEFLGRILGKALYEGITIQPQFAHLFLSFLRGDHTYLHLLTDLSTIDSQLYGNLMFLKTYEGDVSDLCLTFTVNNDDFGVKEVPLIANGASIEVTNENKRRYIYLVAKHHVSDRIKEQSDAFTRGLWDVIDRSWLRLFNEPELQVLISGASDGKIDVADMKSNARYTGGYTMLDRNIIRFWSVVSSLSPEQQAELLRFVTSVSRPPPLGFSSMNPPFTIQRVGIMRDGEKLPTASTCFNTLKLPTYSSEKVLKEKLIYAISAGSGFELT